MYKYLITIIISLLIYPLQACDVCGISTGFNSLGQINTLSRQYLLLESQYISFKHPATIGKPTSSDQIYSQQFHYSWRPDSLQKLQIIANISQKTINRKNVYSVNPNYTITGIGDIFIRGIYSLYDNRNYILDNQLKKVLFLQGGIQIPNGKYQLRGAEKEQLPMHLQPGNGSWQTEFGFSTFIRKRNLGLQLSNLTTLSGSNELTYQLGPRNSNTAAFFYNHSNEKQTIIPQIVFQFDWLSGDKQYSVPVAETRASLTRIGIQIDYVKKSTYVKIRWDKPVWQSISLLAPQPQNGFSISAGKLI
jgi:hypothetical protein